MGREELLALAEEHDCDFLIAEGFDEAIIGVGERAGCTPILVYDREKCLAILMLDGATLEEAEEHFELNVLGAWVGESTPIFVSRLEERA